MKKFITSLFVVGGILAGGMTANAATPVVDTVNIEQQTDRSEISEERRIEVMQALNRVERRSSAILAMLYKIDVASDTELMKVLLNLDIELHLMKEDVETAKAAGSEDYEELVEALRKGGDSY